MLKNKLITLNSINSTNKLIKTIKLFWLPILSIVLCLLPEQAFAAIFNPPHTDKSIEYLGMVFGGSIGSINLGLHPEASPFLSHLFQIFNGIVLSVAIVVLSYVSVISTVNTAQEGQVMGKKWSSVWIPLRSTLGLLLLAPVPGSGYSLLQVTLMWVVLNGIGAADKIWNFVLVNLANGISVTQNIKAEDDRVTYNISLINNGTIISKTLLNNLICVEIIKNKTNTRSLNVPITASFVNFAYNSSANTISETLRFGANDPKINARQSMCGELNINTSLNDDDDDVTNPDGSKIPLLPAQKDKIVSIAHQAKKDTLRQMIADILPVAIDIAKANEQKNGIIVLPSGVTHKGILRHAVVGYQKSMSKLLKEHVMATLGIHLNITNPLLPETVISQGEHFGWITAGSFYYLFNQQTTPHLLSTALNIPTSTQSDPFDWTWFPAIIDRASLSISSVSFKPYADAIRNNHPFNIDSLFEEPENFKNKLDIPPNFSEEAKHHYLSYIKELKLKSFAEIKEGFNAIKESLYPDQKCPVDPTTIDTIINTLTNDKFEFQNLLFKEQSDPLISIAAFGMQLMQGAEACWGSMIVGVLNEFDINKYTAEQKIDTKHLGFLVGLLPAIIAFVGITWGIGASLAIYTPMIPYMIFIVSALSWFMLVIEAIIAAPIVALGLIAPAQDELGKIVPALGIIANIFLKPILMIFGLIFGAKLFKATVSMVNLGFEFSYATIQAQTGSSMFSWIVIIILYTAFIITLVNKCYALIYQLPDKVLRWIGVTGEPTDVSSVKETQQSFDQQSKQAIAPMEGAATKASEVLKKQVESKQKPNPTEIK